MGLMHDYFVSSKTEQNITTIWFPASAAIFLVPILGSVGLEAELNSIYLFCHAA